MCTVSVKIDETTLRDILPELDSTAAISRWAQLLIDQYVDALTKEYALKENMTPDQLYDVIAKEIDSIYANS